MSCEAYNDSMMKYFDGDLNDIETAQLKQHMRVCKSCNEEFEQLGSILQCIEKDIFIEPPQDFEAQVMEKISTLPAVEFRKPNIFKLFLVSVATVVVFVMTTVLTCSIWGISVFKILSGLLGDYPPLANIFDSASIAFHGGFSSSVSYIKSLLGAGVDVLKTHYYFVVLIAVLVFAAEWMIVAIIKQNTKNTDEAVADVG